MTTTSDDRLAKVIKRLETALANDYLLGHRELMQMLLLLAKTAYEPTEDELMKHYEAMERQ